MKPALTATECESEDIAVVGASSKMPGPADTMYTLAWALAAGLDALEKIPAARWDVSTMADGVEVSTFERCRFAGFMADVAGFDSRSFLLSRAEALAMDPQQRLVLERGYESLHRSVLNRHALSGSPTGVFVGISTSDFGAMLRATPAGSTVYAVSGAAFSIACGRVSYILALHGPCVSYDTACSAALVAYHATHRTLHLHECSNGLTVGVNLMLAPNSAVTFAIAGLTSVSGRSHTWDVCADGYARAEACSATTLRPMRDTSKPQSLLGTNGSAVRQDGRSASLTAPNGQAQQSLLGAALGEHGTSALTLLLNEAHGTGTALGDPIEMGSLVGAVLVNRDSHGAPLPVGGVKANIGHAEPAAGMTGLLKLALGLQYCQAVPNAKLRALNPHVGGALRNAVCALLAQFAMPCMADGAISGGVSSFGFAGTIVHVLVAVGYSMAATPNLLCSGACAAVCCVKESVCLLLYRRRIFSWCMEECSVDDLIPAEISSYACGWKHSINVATQITQAPFHSLCVCNARAIDSTLSYGTTWSLLQRMPLYHWRVVLISAESKAAAPAVTALVFAIQLIQQATLSSQPASVLFISCGLTKLMPAARLAMVGSAHGGTVGLSRTLRFEHPSLAQMYAEVACADGASACSQLMQSPADNLLSEIYLSAGAHPCAPTLRRHQSCGAHTHSSMHIPPNASVIITGGLGGLGLAAGAWLLGASCGRLLLTSRSGNVARDGQGLQERLELLFRDGSNWVLLKVCDSSQMLQVGSLLEAAPETSGLMHMPHVIKDRIIRRMQPEDLPYVFTAKAIGAWNLHTSLCARHLDWSLLFSSTATLGGLGISAHSAANSALDAMAECSRACSMQRAAVRVPVILGVGAGAAIAIAATSGEDPVLHAMSLTADQLLYCIQWTLEHPKAVTCGPLRQQLLPGLKPDGSARTALQMLIQEILEPPATALSRNLAPAERLSAARASICALDSLISLTATELPSSSAAVVVGAGLTGLTVAAALKEAGHEKLVILEKSSSVGGVWRFYGNPHSRVNSTEPAYRMRVRRTQPNTDHSYFHEILDDIRHIIEQNDMAPCIHMNHVATAVHHSRRAGEDWNVRASRALHVRNAIGPSTNVEAKMAVLCTNRRLGAPRYLSYEGEGHFSGIIRRGLSADNVNLAWSGSRVVILGHGPYAIEQVRTALENDAAQISLLVRRHGLVCPQIVDYLNLVRPFTKEFLHRPEGGGLMLELWQRAYGHARATPPETWKFGVFRPGAYIRFICPACWPTVLFYLAAMIRFPAMHAHVRICTHTPSRECFSGPAT